MLIPGAFAYICLYIYILEVTFFRVLFGMTADPLTSVVPDTSSDVQAFYPPKQSALIVRLMQSISYPLARVLYKFRISVSESDVGKVRQIDDSRLVFVCNHPTLEDGISVFVLSARLGQMLHYIVARETFKGWMGWLIQRLGCYSIRRGMGDRTSISQTLSLLKEPKCRLVIFPEGGCSYQNDTIMSFRSGAIQMPMSVLAQLAKKTPEAVPDMYVVPLSLKYRYVQSVHHVIEQILSRLETHLKLPAPNSQSGDAAMSDYQRLRRIAHQVILQIEDEADIADATGLDWNERIDRLKNAFIEKCESALQIAPNLNLPIRERVYKVQATLEEIATGEQLERAVPKGYLWDSLYWDTVRLLNFDAIYDGYVAESPTPERFLDTLTRLEREVFHIEHAQPKAPRRACFHIGDPINLKDYLADYKRDRTGTVDLLAERLRTLMQENLDRC